jgi:hypothetical protein
MGTVISPAVMLSPRARNLVIVSSGVRVTVTVNEHELVRFRASVPVHVTVVAPIGKVDPEAGVHANVTGSLPAATVGAAKVTAVPEAAVVLAVTLAGQVRVGGSGSGSGVGVGVGVGAGGVGGGVGAVGLLLHPTARPDTSAAAATS